MIHKINETVLQHSKEEKPKTFIDIEHYLNLPQNANGPMNPTMYDKNAEKIKPVKPPATKKSEYKDKYKYKAMKASNKLRDK